MTKKLALVLALMGLAATAKAQGPYVQGLWTKGAPVYLSQGVLFMPTSFGADRVTTELAPVYHPLSAGSALDLLPSSFKPVTQYLPRESWACTVGAAYQGPPSTNGIAVGCGLNMLSSARGYVASLLAKGGKAWMQNLSAKIEPTTASDVGLFAGYDYADSLTHPGRFAPRWDIHLGYPF
ncbi:MAG: hypothetical protein KGL39_53220 [Patescibacteria group bacterium]|nr:hypothetical protein [Patescibacteria group bacterium]